MNGLSSLTRKPWIWSFAATAVVWIVTVLFTGGASSFGLSHAALTFAAFSVIVGIGQMFVITLGPGNIDLCVPATMTLSGTLALKFMDVSDGLILPGLLIAILIGIAIGIGNYALIKLLRIPPIIATLSMSFIVQSIAIWSNRGLRIKPPETLATFATSSSLGIPNVALVALLLSVIAWLLLDRSFYGRWISAIGQSTFAARMTGIPVDGARFVTYAIRGEEGSGVISVNGAAAHKSQVGNLVIICAYVQCDEAEAAAHKPVCVYVDRENRLTHTNHSMPKQAA